MSLPDSFYNTKDFFQLSLLCLTGSLPLCHTSLQSLMELPDDDIQELAQDAGLGTPGYHKLLDAVQKARKVHYA